MGEAAEDILDGAVCEVCGEFFDDEAPGFPRRCDRCTPATASKLSFSCPKCHKSFAFRGDLRQHKRSTGHQT